MNTLDEKIHNLLILEKNLVKTFGPKVLNYITVFDPDIDFQINFPKLNVNSKNLLETFNSKTLELLKMTGITPEINGSSLQENYLQISKELYTTRFVQARLLFAEYCLVRIRSKMEMQLITNFPNLDLPQNTFTIEKEDLIPPDEFGNVDTQSLITNEKNSHLIANTLSTIGNLENVSRKLLQDLDQITIKGMTPFMYKEQLLLLNEDLATHCLEYFSSFIYSYLEKGLTPTNAKANICSFYQEQFVLNPNDYPVTLTKFIEEIKIILQTNLLKIPDIYPETKQVLFSDYLDLVKLYIQEGSFLPQTYFKISFQEPDPENILEKPYQLIIAAFLINDDGEIDKYPIETYGVELTTAAKSLIFEAVTNNLINPLYTIENYLEIKN
ncbi:MAG: hypothetical protein WCJ58_02195 [bacterium]